MNVIIALVVLLLVVNVVVVVVVVELDFDAVSLAAFTKVEYSSCALVVADRTVLDVRVSVMGRDLLGDDVACYDICRDEIYLREDLLQLLTARELDAVILHEIGHRFDRIAARSRYDDESWYLQGEYNADAFACTHGYGEELISSLEKLVCMHFRIPNTISIVDSAQRKVYEEAVAPRLLKIREYLDS